jgi:glycosyltransferase involved in cell wall biosynthesis
MGQRAAAFAQRLGGRFDLRLIHRAGGKLASLARMTRDLYRFRPAVAYVFDMAWSGVGAGLLYRAVPGARLVIDTGDAITELARSMGRGRAGVALTNALERVSLAFADRVVVRGTYHKEWLAERRVRAEFIPDGVEMDLFSPKDDAPRRDALTVGLVGSSVWSDRLQTCYGWDLVELIRLLKHRPVAGVMIGGGSGIEVLKRRCQEYGLTDRVRFLGHVPYRELPRHLAAMDVCLSTQTDDLPGRVRTTGKLPLYLASGRYVLASRVGEAARVLPDEMLVEFHGTTDPGYPARLAERVERLLADPALLLRGRENVAVARRLFDYDVLAGRVGDVIDSLLPAR